MPHHPQTHGLNTPRSPTTTSGRCSVSTRSKDTVSKTRRSCRVCSSCASKPRGCGRRRTGTSWLPKTVCRIAESVLQATTAHCLPTLLPRFIHRSVHRSVHAACNSLASPLLLVVSCVVIAEIRRTEWMPSHPFRDPAFAPNSSPQCITRLSSQLVLIFSPHFVFSFSFSFSFSSFPFFHITSPFTRPPQRRATARCSRCTDAVSAASPPRRSARAASPHGTAPSSARHATGLHTSTTATHSISGS